MSQAKIRLRLQKNQDVEGGHCVFLFRQEGDGKDVKIGKVVFSKTELPAGCDVKAACVIEDAEAEGLMNDLWLAGIRPTGFNQVEPMEEPINEPMEDFLPVTDYRDLLEAKNAHILDLSTLLNLCLEQSRRSN